MKNNPILIIDDNEDNVMIVRKALKDAKVPNEIEHFSKGSDALNHLLEGKTKIPGLILLDLKMPNLAGMEFLRERISHPELMIIPVIVLTVIEDVPTKTECFRFNIAGYMRRPTNYDDMVYLMGAIHQYWTFSEVAFSD